MVIVMMMVVTGLPVDRKRNIAAVESEISVKNNYQAVSDDTAMEKIVLDTLGIFDNREDSYEPDEDMSVYESIKDENLSLLTKIERLYNVFQSKLGKEQTESPLLTISSSAPHSLIIQITPRKLRPDTMVQYGIEGGMIC